jgi:hypothetical protein
MEKLVYLVMREDAAPGAALREALIEQAVPALRTVGAMSLGVSVEDEAVEAGAGVRIRRASPPLRAIVSFWLHNADDRDACEPLLEPHADMLSGYLVSESCPMRYLGGQDGERAPGANLVTCIRKKPDISYDEFFDLWNNEHKIVALETQSTFAYTRNAVVRALTPDAHPWDGVVEESFPIEALSDSKVWYDCDTDEEYQRRLARMIGSVKAFLDLADMESIPMSQYDLG